jgi:hypothetical protein
MTLQHWFGGITVAILVFVVVLFLMYGMALYVGFALGVTFSVAGAAYLDQRYGDDDA